MHIVANTKISDTNPFVMTEESYVRDINPLKHYINQQAFHLAKMTGKPYDECYAFAKSVVLSRNDGQAVNPTVSFMERQENGDRFPTTLPLTKYITEIIKNEEILAPSGTTYTATKKKPSILSHYIKGNVKRRNIAKKAMFRAKAAGDVQEHAIQKGRQRNRKLSNNAISGAHAAQGTPLTNKSNHSTLTSNCRMTSGQGNANNEKLLSGHRHYWKPDIAYNNIISIVQNTNIEKFDAVMKKYGLHYPSVEETHKVVMRSMNKYCPSALYDKKIMELISRLDAVERAAFTYTSDFYHIKEYNDAFMRGFICALSGKGSEEPTQAFSEALSKDAAADEDERGDAITGLLYSLREDELNLAHAINANAMAGNGKDYKDLYKRNEIKTLATLFGTAKNITDKIFEYGDFIEAILVSDNAPTSVPYFPDAVRESALTSDTDSTIFTVEDWVIWYFGKNRFDEPGVAVANTMIYLAAQAITHILARMSIHAGVDRTNMWLIAMKNEFYFPTFCPTNVSKHYFAFTYIQEGNVAEDLEAEVKGVHLKSSNLVKDINQKAEDMMLSLMREFMSGTPIELHKYLKQVADTERDIKAAISRGDARYTRRGSIKSPDSYAQEKEKSNYNHYMLWRDAFSHKYGYSEEPPYSVVRLPGAHTRPADTVAWLNTLSPDIKAGVQKWLGYTGKDKMGSFMIPKGYVDQNGIPPEILEAVNIRKLVSDISKVFYLVLGTAGLNMLNDKRTELLSDIY